MNGGFRWAAAAPRPSAPHPVRRRHAVRHPRHPVRRALPILLSPRTSWARAITPPSPPVWPGQARRRGRRRRRRAARRARRQAPRRRADHRHEPPRRPQRLAREFGATDIVEARGDEGVAAIKELTDGVGAHTRPGVRRHRAVDGPRSGDRTSRRRSSASSASPMASRSRDRPVLESRARQGRPAPARRFIPELIDLLCHRPIDPGKVFDSRHGRSTQSAEAYARWTSARPSRSC